MEVGETYLGPPIDDPEQLAHIPEALTRILRDTNGYIRFGGGLHLRGACVSPDWHSLRYAWDGPLAFHELYWDVRANDVPFAEDCMGDQFVLREGIVLRLAAETGDLESLGVDVPEFFAKADEDPLGFLQMHPLVRFNSDGGQLMPGQLLAAYPPFCTKEAGKAVSLRAISTEERRRFLADIARQLRDVPNGGFVQFEVRDSRSRRTTRCS